MTASALPRSWGRIQSLTWSLLVLTATRVMGEICGKTRICGYRATCVNDTVGCACSSDGDKLMMRERYGSQWFFCSGEPCGGSRFCGYGATCVSDTGGCVCSSDGARLLMEEGNGYHMFYCLGEGVTECGYRLCGFGTVCNGMGVCRCSSKKRKLRMRKDTFPGVWHCVDVCSVGNRICPTNTICKPSAIKNVYHCDCLPGATRSSTGQCLAGPLKAAASVIPVAAASAVPVTTRATDSNQKTPVHCDSNALTVGLAVGLGEALCVTVVVVVILVIRRHRRRKAGISRDTQRYELHNAIPNSIISTVDVGHSYENIVSLTSPGENRPVNRAGTRVQVETETVLDDGYLHSVHNDDHNSPNRYEDVRAFSSSAYNNDTGRLYESANTTDRSETGLYTTMRQT